MKDSVKNGMLNALRDFSAGVPSGQYPGSEEALFRMAQSHSLETILYHQYAGSSPAVRQHRGFRTSVFSSYVFFFELEKRLKKAAGLLDKAGIPFVFFKGAVIRDAYPFPTARTMGDIDLIVRLEDRDAVDRIFADGLGFKRHIDHQDVWSYYENDYVFEVHTHMFYDPLANDFDYRGYFDHVWDHVHPAPVFGIESSYCFVPDESFHFLYQMAHTAKHIINSGAGFRPYLDMVTTVRGWNDSLDWPWILSELEKMRLLTFTKTCFSLCERWFGVTMPLEKEPLDETFFDQITEKTFNDGIFGFDNAGNEGAGSAREIKREEEKGRSYGFGTVKLLIRKLFPPYKDLQLVPWYSWLDGRPWLLPVAWVYRWFYVLTHKLETGIKVLTEPVRKQKEIRSRQEMLRNWGL